MLRGGAAPQRPLFWHYPHYSNQGGGPDGAVRLGDYKLIEWYEDMRVELFNLRTDPGEMRNLTAEMPDLADKLRNRLHCWRKAVDASMPVPNPDYTPDHAQSSEH